MGLESTPNISSKDGGCCWGWEGCEYNPDGNIEAWDQGLSQIGCSQKVELGYGAVGFPSLAIETPTIARVAGPPCTDHYI